MTPEDANSPACPLCGHHPMQMLYGCQWDYDRWVCTQRTSLSLCSGEIELDTTTTPEGLSA